MFAILISTFQMFLDCNETIFEVCNLVAFLIMAIAWLCRSRSPEAPCIL